MASAGVSDITISTNSTSDRIMKDDPLQSVEGIEQIVPSLKLYAMYGEEYVGVRGFKKDSSKRLQNRDYRRRHSQVAKRRAERRYNRIARCGKTFRMERGRQGGVCARNEKVVCYIGAIAKQSGYFLDDAPYLMLGLTENFSKLILSSENLCNEIHVVLSDKTKVDATVNAILAMDAYKDMLVSPSKDAKYIEEQTQSLTAPIVLAGGAVLALGIAFIVLLFMMSEGEKSISYQSSKSWAQQKTNICVVRHGKCDSSMYRHSCRFCACGGNFRRTFETHLVAKRNFRHIGRIFIPRRRNRTCLLDFELASAYFAFFQRQYKGKST